MIVFIMGIKSRQQRTDNNVNKGNYYEQYI
jgi:hypothetical protein